MATRLVINLEPAERRALTEFAQIEMRDPRDQVRFIIRQLLVEKGYLDETAVSVHPQLKGIDNDSAND